MTFSTILIAAQWRSAMISSWDSHLLTGIGAAFWSSCLPKRREPFSGFSGKSTEAMRGKWDEQILVIHSVKSDLHHVYELRTGENMLWKDNVPKFVCFFHDFLWKTLGGGGGLPGSFFSLAFQGFCVSNEIHKRPFVGANTCVFILPLLSGHLPTPGSQSRGQQHGFTASK